MARTIQQVYLDYSGHVEFLGIEISSPHTKGGFDSTLLHLAAYRGDLEACDLLIQNGADVNARGNLQNTPLHDAALANNDKIIEFLLVNGANKNLENEFGQTPLKVALIGNKEKAILLLKKK